MQLEIPQTNKNKLRFVCKRDLNNCVKTMKYNILLLKF